MMKLLAGLKPLHAADEDFVLCWPWFRWKSWSSACSAPFF